MADDNRFRVLLVEDNAECADKIQRRLRTEGWDVLLAENGIEALYAVTSPLEVDAILLDMNLPAFCEVWTPVANWQRDNRAYLFEGVTLLRLLRRSGRLPFIVAISGIPLNNDMLMSEGANARVDGKDPDLIVKVLKHVEDARVK